MNLDYDLGGRMPTIIDDDVAAMKQWQHYPEHLCQLTVTPDDCDALGHANNVTYLRWLEILAWQHSAVFGLNFEAYQRLNRAMVARHHDITYLRAAMPGDALWLATWRSRCDGRLRFRRSYQIIDQATANTVLVAETEWVCVRVDNGRAARMPAEFVAAYSPVETETN